jgi:hypothetical protein
MPQSCTDHLVDLDNTGFHVDGDSAICARDALIDQLSLAQIGATNDQRSPADAEAACFQVML